MSSMTKIIVGAKIKFFPHKPLVVPGFRLRVSERRNGCSYNDRTEILVTRETKGRNFARIGELVHRS